MSKKRPICHIENISHKSAEDPIAPVPIFATPNDAQCVRRISDVARHPIFKPFSQDFQRVIPDFPQKFQAYRRSIFRIILTLLLYDIAASPGSIIPTGTFLANTWHATKPDTVHVDK